MLIDHHHGLLDRIEGDLPFRRGTLQLLPHLPLGGDVAVDAEHDHLGGIEHRGVDLQRDLAPVVPLAYRFEAVRAALAQLRAQNRRPVDEVFGKRLQRRAADLAAADRVQTARALVRIDDLLIIQIEDEHGVIDRIDELPQVQLSQ